LRFVKCTVSRPALFDNRVLEFEKDITVITGRNGSGKTFIARCLIEGIWKCFSEKSRWLNDAWEDLYLDLCFAIPADAGNEDLYRFRYQMGNLSVFDISGGERELARFRHDEFNARISDSSGLSGFLESSNLESFITACHIPSPTALNEGRAVDFDRLRDILLEDYSGFYKNSGLLRHGYDREGGMDGPLFRLVEEKTRRLGGISKEIEIKNIRNQRIEKLNREREMIEEEIRDLKERRTGQEERRAVLVNIGENLGALQGLIDELEAMKKDIAAEQDRNDLVRSLEEEIDRKYQRFKRFGLGDDRNLDQLQELFREIINLNEEIDSFYLRRDARNKKLRLASSAVSSAALTAALFLLFNSGFSVKKIGMPPFLIVGAVLVAAPLALLYSLFSSGEKRLTALTEKRAGHEEKLKVFLKEGSLELDDYRLSELYEMLLQYFEDYIEYTDNLEELQRVRSSMRDTEHLRKMQRELKDLKKREEALRGEIGKSLKSLDMREDAIMERDSIGLLIEGVDGEIALIDENIRGKGDIISRIEAEKLQSMGDAGVDGEMLLERDALEKELATLQSRRDAVFRITDIMKEAVKTREDRQLKKLVDATLERFHTVTDNQFADSVNERVVKDLISGNGQLNDLNPPVVHALLLSIKISLSGFISCYGAPLPLIIDDPFLFMDDGRIERLKKQIREIAVERQVIIFTHQSADRDWAKIIEL
jgi:DNA repair exonuclease SbcCD ATPase subunit